MPINIGKNFIVGLPGISIEAKEKELLSSLQPAGIIIFKHNISKTDDWRERLSLLISEAKKASQQERFIVSIDHEGGLVHRLPAPITHFPEARDYANRAAEVGQAMGHELASLGFNLNFAPVLDINSEPTNPIIGKRAFGETANQVITASAAFIKAQEKAGVLSCGKHFPGHGDTKTDSHLELPVLLGNLSQLEKRELLPFKAFIKEAGKIIMTAHILFPELDNEHPATLSPIILKEVLRNKLGFKGCVITDDLEMKALSKYDRKEIGSLALNAGVDLLLVANSRDKNILDQALEIAEGINIAIKTHNLEEKIVRKSQERIDHLLSFLS